MRLRVSSSTESVSRARAARLLILAHVNLVHASLGVSTTEAVARARELDCSKVGGAHPRRSANTPDAGEIFHKIGGGRDAGGGFGHPGGDLAGSGGVLRGEYGTQVSDQ